MRRRTGTGVRDHGDAESDGAVAADTVAASDTHTVAGDRVLLGGGTVSAARVAVASQVHTETGGVLRRTDRHLVGEHVGRSVGAVLGRHVRGRAVRRRRRQHHHSGAGGSRYLSAGAGLEAGSGRVRGLVLFQDVAGQDRGVAALRRQSGGAGWPQRRPQVEVRGHCTAHG